MQTATESPVIAPAREGAGAAGPFLADHDGTIRSVVAWPKWRFSREVREDIGQDVRKELIRLLSGGNPIRHPVHFVRTVAVRRCIDEVRRDVRRRETFVSSVQRDADGEWGEIESPAGEEFDPRREVILSDRASALGRLLAELDETCSVAIRCFYVEDLSYREMADRLGLSINTVGSRLAKCLGKLRRMIEREPMLREEFRCSPDL